MGHLGDFNTQRLHVQLHGKANFDQLEKLENSKRNRKINYFLGVLGGSFTFMAILLLRLDGFSEIIIWLLVPGIILISSLVYRLGFFRKKKEVKNKWK